MTTINIEMTLKAFIGATGASEEIAMIWLEANGYSVVGAVKAYRANIKTPEKPPVKLSESSNPLEPVVVAPKKKASQKRSQAFPEPSKVPPVVYADPVPDEDEEEEEDNFISTDAANLLRGDFICSISGYSAPANMRSQVMATSTKGSETIIQLVNGNTFPLHFAEAVVVIRGLEFNPAPVSDLTESVNQLQDKFHSKSAKRR